MRRGRFADRSGFTLVEALVAFTVMATVLGVLYRGVVQTRVGAVGFAAHTRGEVVARSILADYAARRDLRDGTYHGTRDGRAWTLKATAMNLAGQLPKGEKPPVPPKPEPGQPPKPTWVAQRLVLSVATGARPLESEAVHLVAGGATPPDEDRP